MSNPLTNPLVNPTSNVLAELRGIETRIDQRLEILGRAEANLRGLFDALRQQVAAACPVLDQLKTVLPQARQQAEQQTQQDIQRQAEQTQYHIKMQESADQMLEHMRLNLKQQVEQAQVDLDAFAGPIRQTMLDELRAVVQAGRASLESTTQRLADEIPTNASTVAPAIVPTIVSPEFAALAEEFRNETSMTLDGMRHMMIDQIELLKAEAKLVTEPMLEQISHERHAAESHVRTAVELARDAMQSRVQQLTRSVDEIASVMEERLTLRVQSAQRRAGDMLSGVEQTIQTRTQRVIEQQRSTIEHWQQGVIDRASAIAPQVIEQLDAADEQVVQRLARLEAHAGTMSAYLEQKLTARVEELIQRLRLRLHHEVSAVTGIPVPEQRTETPVVADRPNLEVELFVNQTSRGNVRSNLRTPSVQTDTMSATASHASHPQAA
jgi:hypothetical protein